MCQGRNVRMCRGSSVRMSHAKSARTSLASSARTCRDRLRDKSATTSRGRFATAFQERFATAFPDSNVRTFLVNSARMFLGKSATTFQGSNARMFPESSARTCLANSAETSRLKSATTSQEKFATMFPASSASKFPSRCATLPSQPTAESRLKELKRNEDAESGRRILPEARKRHLKLSTKLPGWSQRSYLFLLCNIYGILVKPRVLSRVNKNLKSRFMLLIIFSDQLKIGRFRSHDRSFVGFAVSEYTSIRKNLGSDSSAQNLRWSYN